MKFLKSIGLALILFLLPVLAGADGLGNARLSLMDGDVQIQPEDSPDWIPASINMPLREGDRIWVPDRGRAEVQLAGGSQVRIDEITAVEILNLGRDTAQFYLSAGSAYVNFMAGDERLIQVDTPVSSLRAYERAAFGVDVSDSGITDVSVYRGSVSAESRSGSTTVRSGNTLSLGDDYADMAPLGRQDDWERWNMDRDRRFEDRSYASGRYLPGELTTYASDFDDNGRWVNAPGYGYVWTPTVSVSVGWSPYSNGRWCWVGGDYVWIGYEPWGWAPYHYGRWSHNASIGWFWVPPARGAVYWGPGYVGWVSTPTYVAWVPLAPGEVYYGHGYYGPHSVNITNVNVNKIVVKKVYKNVYVNNAVTVVHHDTFVKGKHMDYKADRNPFLKDKAHIGRPNIKPERETRMPVVREIPRAKEPPQRIREVKVKELKKERPVVKDKNRSVFSPQTPGKRMNVKTLDTPQERKRFKEENRKQIQKEERREMPVEQRQQDRKGKPDGKPQEQRNMERQQKSKEVRPPDAGEPARKQMKPADREPVQDRQRPQEMRPDRQPPQEQRNMERQQKSKEVRPPDAGEPARKQMKPADREPVQDRQMQQQKEKQQKEKQQKMREEKQEGLQGEGLQQQGPPEMNKRGPR